MNDTLPLNPATRKSNIDDTYLDGRIFLRIGAILILSDDDYSSAAGES